MTSQENPPENGNGSATELQASRKLLSRDEIEAEYGVSRRWLELAALSGEGPPYLKISRRMVRYRRSDLERWLEAHKARSTSDRTRAQANGLSAR